MARPERGRKILQVMIRRHVSVGRRLIGLVAVELVCGGGLVALSIAWMTRTEHDLSFLKRFALEPIAAITGAAESVARLGPALDSALPDARLSARRTAVELETFVERYQSEWQVADNPSPAAQAFRKTMRRVGGEHAIRDERHAINDVRRLTHEVRDADVEGAREALVELRSAMRALLEANVVFMQTAQADIARSTERARAMLIAIGLLAGALVTGLGILVHQAIAPRLKRLVRKVEKFREYGTFEREPLADGGTDEIAVLARAIDVGFDAIATRERDRERFLAVAAHELKTPLTSILGFSQAALEGREGGELRERALDVIRRHASRLGRVIDELLLAAAARSGTLSFRPTPVDLYELARRVLGEVEATLPRARFELGGVGPARVLGDEALLSQSLWTLFNYTAAIARVDEPIAVEVHAAPSRCRIEVSIVSLAIAEEHLDQAFTPFAVVQFEGTGGLRTANGLYFCREVAHLHGGHLRVRRAGDRSGALTLELPR